MAVVNAPNLLGRVKALEAERAVASYEGTINAGENTITIGAAVQAGQRVVVHLGNGRIYPSDVTTADGSTTITLSEPAAQDADYLVEVGGLNLTTPHAANVQAPDAGGYFTGLTAVLDQLQDLGEDRSQKRRNLLSFIPRNLHSAIIDQTSSVDVSDYINDALQEKIPLYAPAGLFNADAPLIVPNPTSATDLPFDLAGAGIGKTRFVCRFSDDRQLIELDANTSDAYRLGGGLQSMTLEAAGGVTQSGGLLFLAWWLPELSRLEIKNFPGAGIIAPARPAIDPNPDRYQSLTPMLRNCRVFNNAAGNLLDEAQTMNGLQILGGQYNNSGGDSIKVTSQLVSVLGASIAGNAGAGLVIDNAVSAPNGLRIANNEFDLNTQHNIWVKSAAGGYIGENRQNSKLAGGATLKAAVQIRLGDTGKSVRGLEIARDIIKSDSAGSPALTYVAVGTDDVADVTITEPVAPAGNNTGALQLLTGTGVGTGVKLKKGRAVKYSRVAAEVAIARASKSVDQVVSTGVVTALEFQTESIDNQNALESPTFTAPSAGYYRVTGNVFVQSVATSVQMNLYVRRNGAIIGRATEYGDASVVQSIHVEDLVQCSAGDTIDVAFFHNQGSDLTVKADAALTTLSVQQVQ